MLLFKCEEQSQRNETVTKNGIMRNFIDINT